jgi:serine protease DegS
MSTDLDAVLAQQIGQTAGVLIIDLAPDGPAARAGLRLLDIVIALDGRPTPTTIELEEILAHGRQGQSMAVDFLREGRRRRTTAVLAD